MFAGNGETAYLTVLFMDHVSFEQLLLETGVSRLAFCNEKRIVTFGLILSSLNFHF